MKNDKLEKLFHSASGEAAPGPTAEFEAQVMRALRREARRAQPSLFEQLAELFPRLAVGATALIAVFVAVDIGLTFAQTDFSTGVVEASEQWLFAVR